MLSYDDLQNLRDSVDRIFDASDVILDGVDDVAVDPWEINKNYSRIIFYVFNVSKDVIQQRLFQIGNYRDNNHSVYNGEYRFKGYIVKHSGFTFWRYRSFTLECFQPLDLATEKTVSELQEILEFIETQFMDEVTHLILVMLHKLQRFVIAQDSTLKTRLNNVESEEFEYVAFARNKVKQDKLVVDSFITALEDLIDANVENETAFYQMCLNQIRSVEDFFVTSPKDVVRASLLAVSD